MTSSGFSESAVTLEGLFAARGESVDPSSDATAAPGTFHPDCPGAISGELVLRGGNCDMALAWYNVSEVGSAPTASDLHVLVPSTAATEMGCDAGGFCPLATMSTFGAEAWIPKTFTEDVCGNDAYAGGLIGLALVANDSAICTETKFSEPGLNTVCTDCTPPAPWVTVLIYRSSTAPNAYYLAFEDVPFTGAVPGDGDFNDFVFYVAGLCHTDDVQ